MTKRPTICTKLTPPGRGAVAVISLRGPLAGTAIGQHFRLASGKPYAHHNDKRVLYGIWIPTGEDLVVVRHGPDDLEVHCHGGNAACSAIMNGLAESSVPQVTPAQFARMVDNSWSATTRVALSQASTTRTAKLLLHCLNELPSAIQQLELLIESDQKHLALIQIGNLLRWADFGIHLVQPRSIVLFGKPNVGKSSLVNAIVGFQRAIVHNRAGTTRDVVTQQTAIDGWPVELKDTAGLRTPESSIESAGIENAKSEIGAAHLKICVFDLSDTWTPRNQSLVQAVNPHIIVFNKSDLASDTPKFSSETDVVVTSAETGQGIRPLIDSMGKHLVPRLPDSNQPFPVTPAQRRKLHELAHRLMCHPEGPFADIYDLPNATEMNGQ